MSEKELLGKIAINPKVTVGKPAIKGAHLTLEYIVNKVSICFRVIVTPAKAGVQ
jgi:uncharacterized protein (DUF433 family)